MKVAFVHDWLVHMRGGEKVLEALAEMNPDATIYTLFFHRPSLSHVLRKMKIKASFLQWVPGIRRFYRYLLPLLPWCIQTLRIDEDTDLVISSSHCVAKGARIPKGARHLCYCHTPMRYLWGFEEIYFKNFPRWCQRGLEVLLERLRRWDLQSNARVDLFIANSRNVQDRIQRFYGRDAEVIYPPVDAEFYRPSGTVKDYYLVVSAFVPYKRVDIAIEAFNPLDRPLKIAGCGPLEAFYRGLKKNPQISFLGPMTDSELRRLYSEARALIFPTEEDLGIVPLEAQACGTPVIAYAKGGALETVRHGVFFKEQTAASLQDAILEFEKKNFNPNEIPSAVTSFDKTRFKEHFRTLIDQVCERSPSYAPR